MTIKDIIKIAATMLGREQVLGYLENGEDCNNCDTLAMVDNLTRCANLVISELAFTYIPMKKIERITVSDGKVYFAGLTEKILDLISVNNADGEKIDYEIHSTHIAVKEREVDVEYAYLPSNYGLTDTIGYLEKEVTPRTLALGVISEFLLIERAFNESVMWRERYTDAITSIVMPKSKNMKGRVWR